jgi:hypothetical protein
VWRNAALLALCACRSVLGIEEPAESIACVSADDCGGPYPHCHVESLTCVACVEDSECASDLCDPDGHCVDAAQIAYTSQDGVGAECTRAAPCHLQSALQSDKPNVLVGGVTVGEFYIDRSVRVFPGAGAELHNDPASDQPNLLVVGGGTVEIYRLGIFGNGVRFGAHGIEVASARAVVHLVEVEIALHSGAGVVATGGEITITRSRIHDNEDGGIRMRAPATFTITDNFIYKNGTQATSAGGVYLEGDGRSTFAFNTVVANESYAQSPYVAGISCMGAQAQNNIVYANRHGLDSTQVSGTCNFGNTQFGIDASLVKFAPGDFHISDATPRSIRDAIECTGFDFDHQRRPFNGLCDLGADELPAQ